MRYEDLLEEALSKVPKKVERRERFQPPKLISRIEGNKTLLVNLEEVADYLNRDPSHLFKFLQKELATFGHVKDRNYYVTGKFIPQIIEKKMKKYLDEYVYCRECGSPDTKLIKEKGIHFIQCMACQAKYPVPKIT